MFKKVVGGLVAAMGLLSGSIQHSVSAQSKYMDQYCMPDPQVWGMVKYNGLTPDLYTGTVRAEIPLYTYSDPDFEIPVSLTYASNGYMPNTQANFVGLGWSLNAGGCITRRVQGIRDETNQSKEISINGYYNYVNSSYYSKESDLSIFYQNNMMCLTPDDKKIIYESEPDIFMFSFLGYRGKFILGSSGRAIVFDSNVPSGEIEIDLSRFSLLWPDSCIKIRTADGYEYTFGDLRDYVNNTYQHFATRYSSTTLVASQLENMEKRDSWFLKEIKSPNGRTVSFSYRIDNDTAIQIREPGASYSSVASENVSEDKGSIFTSLSESQSFSSISASVWFYERTKNLALPTSITIGNEFEIMFSYTDRIQEKGYLFSGLDTLSTPVKLNSIRAVDKVSETEILNADLNYKYSSSAGNRVLMLSNVKISGLGEYQMEYYKETEAFPYLGCCAVDHWGYYNSSTSMSAHSMIPNVRLDDDYVETVNGREPDPAMALTGMIKCMKYPTGGSTSYKYEAHKYGKIVTRNSLTQGQFLLDSLSSERIAGGLRLKEIVDSASNSVVSRRTYQYETVNGSSTGIMMDFPRYVWMAVTDTIVDGIRSYSRYINKSSSCPTYLLDGIYIGYSSVREVYGDGSSKVTRFTSWEEFPDMLDESDSVPPLINADHLKVNVVYPRYCFNVTRIPNSASSLRGKVMSVDHFDSAGILLKTEEMKYDMQWGQMEYAKSFDYTIDRQYARRTICESPRLSSRSVIYPDGTLKMETYEYNNKDQIRSVNKVNHDNSQYCTYYFYPQDISSSDRTEEEQEMVDSNHISEPVYVVNTHKRGIVEKIVSVLRIIFEKICTDSLQMFVKGSERNADIPSGQSAVSSGQTVLDHVKSLSYKTLFTWNEYNALGRPCHVTDANGVPSLILWGYDGLYPLAVLKNVTPSMFDSTVSSSGAYKTILGWDDLSAGNESAFRQIVNAAVTVWGWKPFVGITKKSGPDGRTTSYTYDDYGRLASVKGPDGHINSKYTYKLK